ncbi:hypothetical protein DFJ73DRAFT_481813 [Zopfochytrium polystomum]|nr:hypothetical protein DFJ73DRAFT_481813 [Zopfochytrium polystomum]
MDYLLPCEPMIQKNEEGVWSMGEGGGRRVIDKWGIEVQAGTGASAAAPAGCCCSRTHKPTRCHKFAVRGFSPLLQSFPFSAHLSSRSFSPECFCLPGPHTTTHRLLPRPNSTKPWVLSHSHSVANERDATLLTRYAHRAAPEALRARSPKSATCQRGKKKGDGRRAPQANCDKKQANDIKNAPINKSKVKVRVSHGLSRRRV